MNSFEIQKIISAILITVLVVFGIGKISDFIFNGEENTIVAYKVDATERISEDSSASETSVDMTALFALADLAHGKNMVNVILVDFRGMDTLFESSVLGIAGLGVYTMIKLRLKQKNQSSEVNDHE